LYRTRDDQRGSGFIDKNRVDFVDNSVVMAALYAIFEIKLHVVAQVVEAEFVVGSIGHIAVIGLSSFVVIQVMLNHSNRQTQESVDLSHPLAVSTSQIVIHRDDMDPLPLQAVEVDRQGGDQGFTFSRFHLGNLALVENHTPDQLNVEVPHMEDTLAH